MSETKNLKLKKHDNPETNTNTFDIENYLNKNWDKIDENDGKINETIRTLQTKNTQLKEENKKIKEDLKGLPNATVEGESIDLNNSAEMRVLEFEVSGNSRQESREGYNTLNYDTSGFTATQQGWYYLDGKPGAYGTNIADKTNVKAKVETGKTYTVYVKKLKNVSYVSVHKENEMSIISGLESNEYVTFTADYTGYVVPRIKVDNTNVEVIAEIMLYEGTEEKPYEPYGVSPSPDYPSEVESCGDNVNLLVNELGNGIKNGVSYKTNIDGSITLNGTANANTFLEMLASGSKTLDAEEYVLSADYSGIVDGQFATSIRYNEDIAYTNTSVLDKTEISIISPYTYNRIYIYFTSGRIFENCTIYPKLEKGQTKTPYSKYGQGNINIEMCNKNLLDLNNMTGTSNGVNYSVNKNGELVLNGTCNSDRVQMSLNNLVLNDTYTFSHNLNINASSITIKNSSFDNLFITSNKKTNTVNDIATTLICYVPEGTVFNNKIIQLQLEEGEIATDYTPHKSQTYTIPVQQPMRGIGEYKDTFVKEDGKWYERHWIYRYIFKGIEDVTITNSGTDKYFYAFYTKIKANESILPLCSHNKGNLIYTTNTEKGVFVTEPGTIRIRNEKEKTVEEFKTWLSTQYNKETPVYVDYVLETPQDIECTSEQVEKLNKLENAKTYKGVTHIYSMDKVSPNMKVRYLKDIEMMIGG